MSSSVRQLNFIEKFLFSSEIDSLLGKLIFITERHKAAIRKIVSVEIALQSANLLNKTIPTFSNQKLNALLRLNHGCLLSL